MRQKVFFQLIRDSGHKPSIYQTNISTIEADSRLSRLLDIDSNQELFLYERLFLGDDEPVIFLAEYVPMNYLIKAPKMEEIPESIYQFADNFCQETIEYSISEIIPVKANDTLKEKMNLKHSQMFLKLEELHFGKQNRPIIFSDVFVRDSMIRFQVVRKKPLI
jgi:DNA-binding GntR family transcriptional regulator